MTPRLRLRLGLAVLVTTGIVAAVKWGQLTQERSRNISGLWDIPVGSNVRVRGTMDFTGANPTIVISEIQAGNLPDSAAEKLKGQIESLINDRLEDLSLTHDFAPVFTEGSVQVNGTP